MMKSGMRWVIRLLVAAALFTLVFYIGGMVYIVRAKYQMNEYAYRIDAAFRAAEMVNADKTSVLEEEAIIAEYEGERCVIVPENYKALRNYLRRQHAMPPFGRVDRENALHIAICGKDHLYVEGDSDGQGATVRFECADEAYVMHVSDMDLWQKILAVSMEGSYKGKNLPVP